MPSSSAGRSFFTSGAIWDVRARPAKWRGLGSTYDPARFHLLHGGFNESEVRVHQRLLKSSAGHNFASTSRVSIFSRTGSEETLFPPDLAADSGERVGEG